jgi:UDP-2-acetamido-2-deoxy-ribo-hexuluronate aminotransferase
VKNILIDLNILLDYYSKERRKSFPDSVKAFDSLRGKEYAFISASSIDNFEFMKYNDLYKSYPEKTRKERLEVVHEGLKEILSFFKIAKTPSYMEIDYDDIEDSQILASAKAVDALVLTRDEKLLAKHPDRTISPTKFLKTKNQKPKTIDFANLKKQYFRYQPELEEAMDGVLNRANYIMGDPVRELEQNLCDFTEAAHAVTCGSGTDALLLAMMALDIKPGDEVITTPFTFIATAETIALLGARPVFVDIDEETYNIDPKKIESAITERTKAIMPVSLYGQPADMDEIQAIADKHGLKVIVDGAQSFGSIYKGKAEVHYCNIYTTSFFPAKPLGCFGDGGAVFTDDGTLAEKIRLLRVHGQSKRYHHKYIGLGARMDTIQCAVVDAKLSHYTDDIVKRQTIAKKYTEQLITYHSSFITPVVKLDRTSVYAQYSIRVQNREELQAKLNEAGIPTAVHYPMPLHLQEAFAYLEYKKGDFPIAERISNEIISLPMNPYLSDDEIVYITETIVS